MSKSTAGHAEVVRKVIELLTTKGTQGGPEGNGKSVDREPNPQGGHGTSGEKEERLKITVLTSYTEQVSELKICVPNDVDVFMTDLFQGRESDIIIISIVRCNLERDIGFVEDERRLNVAWTRARLALIIVGDQTTLAEKSGLWKWALDSCTLVTSPEGR